MLSTAFALKRCNHNLATLLPKSRPNRGHQLSLGRLRRQTTRNNKGRMMTEQQQERLARERKIIAERIASFRATQKKFEEERQEYYKNTMSNAWDGFDRPIVWPSITGARFETP